MALEEVPPRLLSETLRECDLFVGVASVGNDPAWHDQGATPEIRAYWHEYAFGALDMFAETRAEVLAALLPRLAIRDVARVEGRFVVVEGKLNTYRIHLGSSNIQMDPGNRYLCIVPGGGAAADPVALPFEGDGRLSVILSKAIMLAADDKITAPDIVRQLKREPPTSAGTHRCRRQTPQGSRRPRKRIGRISGGVASGRSDFFGRTAACAGYHVMMVKIADRLMP